MLTAVVLLPATALVWLAWRTLQQDDALEQHRANDRLQRSADLVTATLQDRLRSLPEQLPGLYGSTQTPPEDSLLLCWNGRQLETRPAGALLYLPALPPSPALPSDMFSDAERLEFRASDYRAAARLYEARTKSPDPALRAAALVAVARNLRKARQPGESAAALARLAVLDATPVDGVPAGVIARHERCRLLAETDSPQLGAEAAGFHADLQRGRWPLDRGLWEFYSGEASRWSGANHAAPHPVRIALAEAAAALHEAVTHEAQPAGLRSAAFHGQPLLLVWNRDHSRQYALAAGSAWLGVLTFKS